jgi:hypothetical protein
VEFSLINFYKVPFTCSFMPGKANVQAVFWGAVFIWIMLTLLAGTIEMSALQHGRKFMIAAAALAVIVVVVGTYNRIRARSAILYFEDTEPEMMTRLNLMFIPPAQFPAASARSE